MSQDSFVLSENGPLFFNIMSLYYIVEERLCETEGETQLQTQNYINSLNDNDEHLDLSVYKHSSNSIVCFYINLVL